ncbi:MAG: hypothetical protein JST51_19280 [Armatimonadetes bacterium]|nr:hypothetical protein [Armatimonadota bacterium]
MQYAVTRDGEKIEAVKDVEAFCPICLEPVLARCGRIKIHHWAHVADLDCDSWTEPETEWHRAGRRSSTHALWRCRWGRIGPISKMKADWWSNSKIPASLQPKSRNENGFTATWFGSSMRSCLPIGSSS